MKTILLILVLAISGCSTYSDTSYTEYRPFTSEGDVNCVVKSSDIYVINGTPSLEYICNKTP